MHKVILIGRLTADPDLRVTTTSAIPVARFSLAADRPRVKEGQQDVDFIDWVAWRKLGEIVAEYLHKGSLVYIEGSLETRRYDKDGVTHYSTSIKGRELRMLEKRGDGAEDGSGAEEGVRSNARAAGGQRGNGHRNSGPGSNGGSSGTRAAAPSSQPVEDDDFDLGTIPF